MLAAELTLGPDSGMVHAGPVTHGSGSKIIAFVAAGGRNILLPRFDPELVVAAIEQQGGTHTFLVPTMIQRLLEAGPERGCRGLQPEADLVRRRADRADALPACDRVASART